MSRYEIPNPPAPTYDAALALAQGLLDAGVAGEFVITGSDEHEACWVFYYDSRRHLQTGDLRDAIGGNSPILIDRFDGSVHPTGTALPTEHYVHEHAERRRWKADGWPDSITDRWRSLLDIVKGGAGRRTAQTIEVYLSRRHAPNGRTVLAELLELERRGLVAHAVHRPDEATHTWRVTDAGERAIDE
jgi:hypothetical protein